MNSLFYKSKRFIRLLLRISAGLFFCLLIIELSLRIAGLFIQQSIYQEAAFLESPTGPVQENYILCVGDSHTQGIGADQGFDYPKQLENLINSNAREKRYRSINLGQAGFNSSQAADRAVDYIRRVRGTNQEPAIVIFNSGRNNNHNFTRARFLPEDLRILDSKMATIRYLFSNSRAFRLGQVAHSRLNSMLEDQQPAEDWPDFSFSPLVSKGEMEFFEEWMRKDIDYLYQATQSIGADLILLNYWVGVTTWVDRSFEKFAQTNSVLFVDVRRFGGSVVSIPANTRYLVASDGHPNNAGYGRIASIVYDALAKSGKIQEMSDDSVAVMAP